MQKPTITLKTVLHEIQEAGTEFSLKFRKLDGDISFKPRLIKNPTKVKTPAEAAAALWPGHRSNVKPGKLEKDLTNVRRNMKKAGALLLRDEVTKEVFECKIELLVEYNGHPIFHNF